MRNPERRQKNFEKKKYVGRHDKASDKRQTCTKLKRYNSGNDDLSCNENKLITSISENDENDNRRRDEKDYGQ